MRRIAAKYLYTLENFEPLINGFVEIDDCGKVVRIGICDDINNENEYIDGAVIPGFVNSHCHIELSSMWKLFKKGTGMAGFIDQINALRDTKSKQEKLKDIELWMDRLWKQGVSAMCDISNCDDSFKIKAASPIYTRTFLEVFGTEPKDCNDVMNNVIALKNLADEIGIDAAPTPHSCYTMSPELLSASSKEGLKSGYLSFHCEETDEEEQMMIYGRGPMYENRQRSGMSVPPAVGKSSLLYFIDRLNSIQKPPFAEHILLVHECCLNQEGIDGINKSMINPFIALCPLSNIFIHNTLPPVDLMRNNGLKLTIGTDSLSSNDDLNMVKEIFSLQENFTNIPLGELLTWASKNGAEFLNKQDTFGSIEVGKTPGIVAVANLDIQGKLTSASYSYRVV